MDQNKILKIRFSLKARISLYERIGAFLEAGIPIIDTIETIKMRYEKNKDFKSKILASWIEQMTTGTDFSTAVAGWMPTSEHMLIEAGEKGGDLISGLREATTLSNAAARSKSAIIGGVAFPSLLAGVLMLMLVGFQIKMVPTFSNLLPIDQWPGAAQSLNSLSLFVKTKIIFILIGLAILGFGAGLTIGSWKSTVRTKFFDRIPPWSVYRSYQASSFLVGLSSLLKAGVSLNDSLKMMHENGSPWMQEHLERMMSNLKRGGENHGESLDTGLLDNETAGDVQDYSRLGSFQDAIYILGTRSIEKGVQNIQSRMAILKNMMLFLVGGTVIWIYATVYALNTTIADSLGTRK